MGNLNELTIHALQDLMGQGQIQPEEILRDCQARIEQVEDRVKAFITLTPEVAEAQLSQVKTLRPSSGPEQQISGAITGIPMALKDNLCTQGIRTTCASRILENFIPPYNGSVVEALLGRAGVLVGKVNLDEFAMGSSTENSAFFPTANPWDLQRVPGGSSGGSAAAVAADEVIFALGSDTGGSIRLPASFCGVVGLKPTYGRVSRYGLVAYASSLDQIGPITKDVRDCALVLQAIAGHDPRDSTSAPVEVPDYSSFLKEDLAGLRIGVPKEYFGEGLNPEVREVTRAALEQFTRLGATWEEVSLPHTDLALAAYYIIAPAEASSNLARYDGVSYGLRAAEVKDLQTMYDQTRDAGFGSEVKRRIMLGTYALSSGYYDAYYVKALKIRNLIKQEFDQIFQNFDLIVSPTAPNTAFRLGEIADPLSMYLTDVCTIPANLAGIPGISVPCGFVQNLPVGLQIMGGPFAEGKVLQAAYAYEQSTPWHQQKPNL